MGEYAGFDLASFLDQVCSWAAEDSDIVAVVLVGSQARGTARLDSDVDLVILTRHPERLPALAPGNRFPERFGKPLRQQMEHWGRVTSLRIWFEGGPEVEFGITTPDWADRPLDAGTRRVLTDGCRILADKTGLFTGIEQELSALP